MWDLIQAGMLAPYRIFASISFPTKNPMASPMMIPITISIYPCFE
jgi:hypothetical protein